MRMAATDRAARPRLESDEHRSPPALDEARGEGAGRRHRQRGPVRAWGQRREQSLCKPTRFGYFLEPHRDARRHVTFLAHYLHRHMRVIRRGAEIDPRIERLAAGAAHESQDAET